jgi:hypothetical protein
VAATLARDLSWAAPFELLLTFLIKPNFPSFVWEILYSLLLFKFFYLYNFFCRQDH